MVENILKLSLVFVHSAEHIMEGEVQPQEFLYAASLSSLMVLGDD